MKTFSCLFAISLISLGNHAGAQSIDNALPDQFSFQFSPPNALRVQQHTHLSRVRSIPGIPDTKDEMETKTEGVFRRVGETFEYAPNIVMMSMTRNGNKVNDPVTSFLAKIQSTYVISAAGEALDVKGFDAIEPLLKTAIPPHLAAAVSPFLSEAAIVAKEKAEWNARYAEFANGTFKVGETIDTQATYELPSKQSIEYKIRTTFSGWEPCPAGHCIRIQQVYDSDARALASTVSALIKKLGNAASAPEQSTDHPSRITGSISRLIDPKTMLIYTERASRKITMPVQIPGQGAVPSIQTEERSYTYTYQ